jgi:hypothetical protein
MPKIKIAVEDLKTMYNNCLVLYKNKPVFITNVENTFTFHAFDLTSQRKVVIKVDEYEELKPPARHLGFVNCAQYVVYLSRKTIRRYRVGLNNENMSVTAPEGYGGILGNALVYRVYELKAPEIVDTVFARYPTIVEAYDGCMSGVYVIVAFDRQFAVDNKGFVYYKTRRVGSLKEKPQSVYDIRFTKGNEHLITLLDNNYEKSTSTARA